MGLFGLGWAEIGVIGVIALFLLGPERLAPLAKDIGKASGGLKEVADSFQEGISEGVAAADDLKSAKDPLTVAAVEEKEEGTASS